ncbi:hypothetical protein, partial [Phocaeicola massiliensis]|uniref:hypothetical protein n=1 Tax=Phocaeicola massiliensis TaxID=204516 RepID=UPI000E7D620E
MNIIGLLSHRNIDKQKDSIHAMRESNFYQLSFEAETTFRIAPSFGSVVILGGLTFVNFPLCIH